MLLIRLITKIYQLHVLNLVALCSTRIVLLKRNKIYVYLQVYIKQYTKIKVQRGIRIKTKYATLQPHTAPCTSLHAHRHTCPTAHTLRSVGRDQDKGSASITALMTRYSSQAAPSFVTQTGVPGGAYTKSPSSTSATCPVAAPLLCHARDNYHDTDFQRTR